jgi:hypothetical protein
MFILPHQPIIVKLNPILTAYDGDMPNTNIEQMNNQEYFLASMKCEMINSVKLIKANET